MHFASLADWPVTPWNGNPGIVRQHARGPASLVELHNLLSAMFRLTRTSDGYSVFQIERQELVSFNGTPPPPPGTNMEGFE